MKKTQKTEPFTPLQRLALAAGPVAATLRAVMAAGQGESPHMHQAGIYVEEKSAIISPNGGGPQRIRCVGIRIDLNTANEITEAWEAVRQAPFGKELLEKITALQEEAPN